MKINDSKIANFYYAFADIVRMLHAANSAKEIMDLAVRKTPEIFGAKGATMRIKNPDTNQYDLVAAFGMGEKYLGKGPVSEASILSGPIKDNKVMIIEDLWNAPRVEYPNEAWEEGIRMIVDSPLKVDADVMGVIRLYFSEKKAFEDEDLEFLIVLGQQFACAISKARLIEAQQVKYDHLVLQTDRLAALGRLAAGIAHEINNPLAGILLYSSSMRKKAPAAGPIRDGLNVIIDETQRCKKIIEGLLEFARDKPPNKLLSSLNSIVEKAIMIVENEFRINRIELKKDLASDFGKLSVDPGQIEQVLVNLLMNGLQAVKEGGWVSIQTSIDKHRKCAWIEISDNGCGIPRENLKRVFEPFFSTKSTGTGLGLAVSYGIIRNHQGDMEVISEPGKGSRFIIELPISQMPTISAH